MYVGLDIGYGQTKQCYAGSLTRRSENVWPSGAAQIARCDVKPLSNPNEGKRILASGLEVKVDGHAYGALMHPDDIQGGMPYLHEDYATTPEYFALFLGAISYVPASAIDVLVTGLPVAHFEDVAKREALKKRLTGTHEAAGRKVKVSRVEVVPQGLGAFMASEELRPNKGSAYDTCLVVDVGHYSVDWVLVLGNNWRSVGSGSTFDGSHKVLQKVADQIKDDTGLRIDSDRVLRMVMDGVRETRLGANVIKVQEIVERCAAEIAPRVANAVRSKLSTGTDVTSIILTGGGAPFYREAIREAFANADLIQLPRPAMSNAIGYQCFAELYARQEQRA